MKSVFNQADVTELKSRIETIANDQTPQWGKMNAAQMFAHCNVTYEMIYETIHPVPGAFKRFILKALVKPIVTNEKPYKQNSPTSKEFLVASTQDFEREKTRLLAYVDRVLSDGTTVFEGKASHSFGNLTVREWNNMLYKHLNHHLTQFGA